MSLCGFSLYFRALADHLNMDSILETFLPWIQLVSYYVDNAILPLTVALSFLAPVLCFAAVRER
jgi:hypothetical protein